eukprot:scaffold346_cov116-Cylindrotheca_fusiformis.AAC.7
MDNPNTSRRLRRHRTLPNKLRLPSPLMRSQLRLKSNPYIGSFRHSPPTSFRSMEACAELRHCKASTSVRLKSSPYIGWFRHAPPTKMPVQKIDPQCFSLKDRFQGQLIAAPGKNQVKSNLDQIINGRLLGGGNDKIYSLDSKHQSDILHYAQLALQESSKESSSGTVKMLSRIGYWLLFPLANGCESEELKSFHYKNFDSIPEDSMSWTSSGDESSLAEILKGETDNYNDIPGTVSCLADKRTPAQPLDISISHVAEAYYAHQAIEPLDELSPDTHRLDYVITQMDIARMARNASRHLDVESILTLPTITYRSSASTKSKGSNNTKESWSFIMVPEETAHGQNRQNDHFCVICMEHFVDGDRLRVLPCNHSFHVGCIDRWLSGSHSEFECFTSGCPTCKKCPLSVEESNGNDGSVPAWAFAQLGDALARSVSNP